MLADFNSELFAWVRGGFFVLAIYHLLIFFQNGKKIYLYYCLFLLSYFIFFSTHFIRDEPSYDIIGYITVPVYYLSFAAMFEFNRVILETRTRLPKWDKLFHRGTIGTIIVVFLFILLKLFLGINYHLILIKIVGPIFKIFILISCVAILQTKLPSAKYISFGMFTSVIFSSITLILIMRMQGHSLLVIGDIPIVFIYIGTLIQSLVFAYVIGLSVKRIELQNKSAEIKLAFKYKELEELKMTALQSQMNPHFLFNSLNSINNFVLKSDIEKASDYITKFSRLIRVILKSSTSLTIPFSEELGILSLYVKLEQMRITGGFEYLVEIDEDIDLDIIDVPPLFLQPFIENSIWHGLTKIEGEKKISLSIKKDDDTIVCVIVDNGIGINKTKEQAHKHIERRKFFGTQATENRIKLLYRNADVDIDFEDISNENESGTMVTIRFPHIIKR